jgi:adenine phosphoribosyltransferase
MNFEYYSKKITEHPDRYDLTPIFEDPEMFSHLIKDLSRPFTVDKVVGLDALGFIIGAPIALKLGVGFVPVRKGGKLPGDSLVTATFIDYSKKEKSLEMNKNAIRKGERVLIVDDWIETGVQVSAAITLVEELGGVVVGISAIGADSCDIVDALSKKYSLHTISP